MCKVNTVERDLVLSNNRLEEWVAVSYSRDLRYIGWVVKEDKRAIRIQFLEKRRMVTLN